MSNSQWTEYVGIVVEDRKLHSREIKVFLREMTPFASGAITDNTRKETYSVTDDSGAKTSGNVSTTNNITADYYGGDSNRAFPPDVVKGEQVTVLKYADEDKYYWKSMGRDDNMRKSELVRLAASNNPAGSGDLNESNTYMVELDTKLGKRIRLKTSTSSGEAFGYDFIIDAKNSFVQITDNAGNRIELLSQENKIKLTNQLGTTVNLEGAELSLMAPGDITVRAGGTLTMIGASINVIGPMTNTGSISNNGNITNNGNTTNNGDFISSGQVKAPNIPH